MIDYWPKLEDIGEFARLEHSDLQRQAAEYHHTGLWAVEVPTYLGAFAVGASAFGVLTVLPPVYDQYKISAHTSYYRLAYSLTGRKMAIEAGMELMGYALGQVRTLETPVDLSYLTPFAQDVLLAVRTVPYGATLTVTELAACAGHPGKIAPILHVLRHNPAPVFVPCHRILPNRGGTGDWSGPPGFKQELLELEGVPVNEVVAEA